MPRPGPVWPRMAPICLLAELYIPGARAWANQVESRILIADGNRNLSGLLRGSLGRIAENSVICRNAEEALERLSGGGWHVFICDISMWSQTRGGEHDMIVAARASGVPVLVLVDDFSQHLVGDAMLAGALAVVLKTYDFDDVLSALGLGGNEVQKNDCKAGEVEMPPLRNYLEACEKNYMRHVFESCGGNKERAAKTLGISLASFYRKFKEE